ncbi:hypothetical protein PFICI_06230 [Pestalotiopsis fici W106-1]|uniref:Mitochondrial distribution and morphology protein 12 n=1 Tax=Pestalotiopsis fici (strain W106-1 / CGMCC3.15140) TaxID=1229662 RepID=W3X557_PESFW|nr:uncharacterized protein PFICI_06230 [Pestalotiopsis fici W106-1]ETS81228.1 hypothetical protein PFICI_06230 [Pestalotiopsis fici W106-1]
MSIDLNWDTLTSGPDGDELAGRIRDFIHTKFQAVPLPRFIKSVKVHDFQFGSIPPKVTLKDICDPLPDFYEEMPEADEQDDEASGEDDEDAASAAPSNGVGHAQGADEVPDAIRAAERRRREEQRRRLGGFGLSISAGNSPRSASPAPMDPLGGGFIHTAGLRSAPQTPDVGTPFLGIPGGTANMHYFPSHIATGWPSGTQTPLAAVAGAQHLNGRFEQYYPGGSTSSYPGTPSSSQGGRVANGVGGHHRNHSQSSSSISIQDFPASASSALLREKHSVSTLAPTSAGASRPPTRDANAALTGSAIDDELGDGDDGEEDEDEEDEDDEEMRKFREPRIEDMQAVFRIKYAGDIKLMLTAEILLDYPMPSFVGIPVKLNITGLSFDGVGVVANIRKRVHFCFLSPEDAVAAVGNDDDDSDEEEDAQGEKRQKGRMGGLLQEIKVESEIGQREGIKQSLKNVGKVERFVLEQVRRIFEEEFVYPSFWTFLV